MTRNVVRGLLIAGATLALVFIALLNGDKAVAYESYHDPNTQGQGYCATCHEDFRNGGLHDLHEGFFNGGTDCNTCHTGAGRDNPLTMWSVGDGLGCAGCHGRDYGETTANDYRGLPSGGKPKMSGWGLRRWHENQGVTECENCHGTNDPIQGEDVSPPNYARADINITDSCNSDGSEDGSPEPNGEDTFGLDNDGDTLIDGADPDCSVASDTPGESVDLFVGINRTTGVLTLTWTTGCVSTDNVIEYGDLNNVSAYSWLGQECAIGTAGTYDWTPPGTPDSLYFVIVGRDTSAEGSYGQDSSSNERPEDATSATCPLGQDLTSTCVP